MTPTISPIKGLYLITDHNDHLLERVAKALSAGVTCLQYRNKVKNYASRLAEARELQRLCLGRGVTFIVNDDLPLAAEVRADGVHFGQDDGSVGEARRMLGPEALVGISTHSLEEALRAEEEGADYIGFGAMYPTESKDVRYLPGPAALAEIRAQVRIPIVAIGGITRDNAPAVLDAGADAIAVISSVLASSDPELAALELALLFNRTLPAPRGTVLTVAGSDSGGGAGIQADLKTATLLGSYAASVITALTAQNTRGVSAIHGVPAPFVAEQLDAVFLDIPVDVVKTGMLFSAEIIVTLVEKLACYGKRMLVLDPVMVAKGGSSLIDDAAIVILLERLLPSAYLITPNVPEAEALTGLTIRDEDDLELAARELHHLGARNVLLKGGHLSGPEATDILFDGKTVRHYVSQRFTTNNTHGTGCTYASAIAAFLAQGEPLPVAVARAKEFVSEAIRRAVPLGQGHGPVNHFLAAQRLLTRVDNGLYQKNETIKESS
ncbi:MAG: bifunctional hydroxymethylpyrimidine kinase/phosphomethylpyrimidine kinase [Deltaproteobacteria bacterium]|nr:bifunctional hydroxymethylpyrimidine kinase/phosphomethylpyrimidine kinase [Deltaproteobacteria bacterium]TLN00743.1 MAG: bifunctional hydroxymethylpyrimidine kinase/phosphomethylpyrimidine kinase [bacterium]